MKQIIADIKSKPIENIVSFGIIAVTIAMFVTPYYKYAFLPALLLFVVRFFGAKSYLGYFIIVFFIAFTGFSKIGFVSIPKFVGACTFLVMLSNLVLKKVDISELFSNLWVWLILFFIVWCISAVLSEYRSTSFNHLRKLLTAYAFIALTLVYVSKREYCITLPFVIICSVSISAFFSVFGYIFGISLFSSGSNAAGDFKRAIGTVDNPNEFCSLAIFSLPFLVHFFFFSKKVWLKGLIVVLFFVGVISVILSFSRSGATVAFITIILLAVGNLRRITRKHVKIIVPFIVLTLIILTLFVPDTYWDRLKNVTNQATDTSIGRRTSYLYVGWQAIQNEPVFGTGPGTFREIYGISSWAAQYGKFVKDYVRSAHNSYLEIVVGTGLLGVALFAMIVLRSFLNFTIARKHFKKFKNDEMFSIVGAYRLALFSYLIFYFMSGDVYNRYLWGSFAFSQIALNLTVTKEVGNEVVN